MLSDEAEVEVDDEDDEEPALEEGGVGAAVDAAEAAVDAAAAEFGGVAAAEALDLRQRFCVLSGEDLAIRFIRGSAGVVKRHRGLSRRWLLAC
eukprot:g2840.t1